MSPCVLYKHNESVVAVVRPHDQPVVRNYYHSFYSSTPNYRTVSESIRLLHVDDDPEFIDLTVEFLDREYEKFDILQATDADAGLETLQTEPIDCVVCDYKLPGMNGIELLETVRGKYPELPFILFTGKGSEAVASRAISAGATDYFRKGRIEDQYELLANRVENAVTATTNRRRVESREREYRTLVDQAPIPMVVVGQDRKITYLNERAVDTLDATDEGELVGLHVEELFPDETVQQITAQLARVLDDRTPIEAQEFRFLDLSGNVRYARGTIVPVTFDDEPAAQVVVSDVTERMKQQRRIQEQRRQIAKLHDVGVDLAYCEHASEVYELMVETAEVILELDLCVVDSVSDGQLTVEATSSELTEYEDASLEEGGIAAKAYQTGESFLIADTTDHPDADPVGEFGSTITVPLGDFGVFQAAAYETAVFDEFDLELVEILAGHVREALTRLEQEQQLLEQRDRLQRENERLDEFASIISHDLRNPLNVAQLRLDLAMNESDSEHLAAVTRAVDRMETLTDELLTLARQGDEVTETEPVELASVTTQCWANVETDPATCATETDAVIRADKSRIQQLLENLMRNAVEHGSTGNRPGADGSTDQDDGLTITVGRFDGGFYVADDGVGMSEEVRKRAFESGFSTSDNGTGFGLAIVARVAEAHGWTVTATDSDSGGARFEFTGVDFVS
jgi:PAS domain S-box-containing protein